MLPDIELLAWDYLTEIWREIDGDYIKSCKYVNGFKEGKETWYDKNTLHLYSEIDYVHGVIHGKYISYENGKIIGIHNYINGKVHGKVIQDGLDSGYRMIYYYNNGVLHGFYKIYDNGQLTTKFYMFMGTKIGVEQKWSPNGVLVQYIERGRVNLHGFYMDTLVSPARFEVYKNGVFVRLATEEEKRAKGF